MVSFTIGAAGLTGPRRWWHVRVHPNVEALRRAAKAYHPGVDFGECYACCQAAVWFDNTTGRIERYGHRGYAGVIRFAADKLTGEIITHELLHAAVATYRMNVDPDVVLGQLVDEREEELAYIYGDLFAELERRFRHPLGDRLTL